jgi:ATP-dependent Clp protease ATP-binding subunit ClpA
MATKLTYSDFDANAVRTMRLATESAWKLNHDHIDTEHILIGFIRNSRFSEPVFAHFSVQSTEILDKLKQYVHRGCIHVQPGKRVVRINAKRVTLHATQFASDHGALAVNPNHLLLGMLFVDGCVESEVLRSAGLRYVDTMEYALNL